MPLVPEAPYLERIREAIANRQTGNVVHVADVLAAIFAGTGITIDRSTPNQITIAATGGVTPATFNPTSLAGASIAFTTRNWFSASSEAVPATANWLMPTVDHDDIGALPMVNAAHWRTLQPSTVGTARAAGSALPLKVVTLRRGAYLRIWLAARWKRSAVRLRWC